MGLLSRVNVRPDAQSYVSTHHQIFQVLLEILLQVVKHGRELKVLPLVMNVDDLTAIVKGHYDLSRRYIVDFIDG
jgi:hypothetical protein